MNEALPYRTVSNGIEIRIRLTPKSSRDQFGAIVEAADGSVLQAFVRALPRDGAANTALIELVAKRLGIAKSHIKLQSGARSRIKTLAIEGDCDRLAKLIDDAIPQ